MSTVLETIDSGTRYLEKRGVEDARRNMQMLVAHQLGCTRIALYLRFDETLTEDDLVPLREALRKRGEGIPIQHILGTIYFINRQYTCDARALIPRPETEELAELILTLPLPAEQNVLDMGCGSGVLGLTLAGERCGWTITMVDVSQDALSLTKENATRLGIFNTNFICSDLFSAVPHEQTFDGIVANLPYVGESERTSLAKEVMCDPALALFSGTDGLDLITRFIPQAFAKLRPGGWLAMEIGFDQASQVSEILRTSGFSHIDVKTDMSGVDRFPFARRG